MTESRCNYNVTRSHVYLAIVCQWKIELPRQICCAIKLSDKLAQLCCVSDIGLTITTCQQSACMPAVMYRMPYKQQVEEQAERIRSLTAERDSLKIEVNHSKVWNVHFCNCLSDNFFLSEVMALISYGWYLMAKVVCCAIKPVSFVIVSGLPCADGTNKIISSG